MEQMILLNDFLHLFCKSFRKINKKMIGSEFIFDSVNLLNYHLQKTSLKRARSYIDSPKWLENKKATINTKNNDDNCFQYALTLALNYQDIKKTLKEYQKLSLLLISMIGQK